MLTKAIEAEMEAFLAAHADLTDDRGRRRVVRNGHAPERHIQTGIGALAVSRPRECWSTTRRTRPLSESTAPMLASCTSKAGSTSPALA
jgi:hypothetical protein